MINNPILVLRLCSTKSIGAQGSSWNRIKPGCDCHILRETEENTRVKNKSNTCCSELLRTVMWILLDCRMSMGERGLKNPHFLPAQASVNWRSSACLSSLQFWPWKNFTQTFLHAPLPTDFNIHATHDKGCIPIISTPYLLGGISWIVL